MKKVVAVLVVLVALTFLLACGDTEDAQTSPTPDHNATAQAILTANPIRTPTPTRTPQPTPTPTHTPQWTTIQTFQGNGNKKTTTFIVPNSWKLVWSCDPSSDYFGDYNLFVDVVRPDGSYVDPGAVSTTCKAGNTGDSTQEYQGGTVYLDIQCDDVWAIQIQVLK